MADTSPMTAQELELDAIRPRPLSRLTYKILSFNLLVVFFLAMGVTYLGSARKNLIESKLDNLEMESYLYSYILKYQQYNTPDRSSSDDLASLLEGFNVRDDQVLALYHLDGTLIARTGNIPVRGNFERQQDENSTSFNSLLYWIENLFSVNFHLDPLPPLDHLGVSHSQEKTFRNKDIKIAAWSTEDGGLAFTSFMPVLYNGHDPGLLRVIRRDIEVEDDFSDTRLEVLRFLGLAMLLTIAHSLYLAGEIGHPLRKLAMAAEAYRLNRVKSVEIPDLGHRRDEIGELSHAMRDMTKALHDRISTIEQFAADVSHELKNPLTSLRSALETIPRAKKDDDRERLMNIALHDLQRIDRLISDISQASRLDAELSRSDLVRVDLRTIILPLVESMKDPMVRGTSLDTSSNLICEGLDTPVYVYGQPGRLEQVFQNLIGNALSFAPEGTQVLVLVDVNNERVKIMVDDFGPGIPDNRLEKVFERFYSERPVSENFGMHSGLGLSIAKQIVLAHGGLISAENRKDESGNILGARFIVRLRVAEVVL